MTLAIIAFAAIGIVVTAAFFRATQPEKPDLTLVFRPPLPPWHVKPGYSFQVGIEVMNNAGTSSVARGVQVKVVAPPGFIISGSNANQWNRNFGDLDGGDGENETLTVTVMSGVQPGNYNIETRTWATNAPEQIGTSQVVVELTLP